MRLLLSIAAIITATALTAPVATAQDGAAEKRKRNEIVQKNLIHQIELLKRALAAQRVTGEKRKAVIAVQRIRKEGDGKKEPQTIRLRAIKGDGALQFFIEGKPGTDGKGTIRIIRRKVESKEGGKREKRGGELERREQFKKIERLKAIVAEKRALSEKQRAVANHARAIAEEKRERALIELKKAHARKEANARERRQGESRRRGERPDKKNVSVGQRLEHIRAAIEHLKAAGLKELAQAAGQRAENIQKELHAGEKRREEPRRREGHRSEKKPQRGGVEGNIRELSGAIVQLRKQMAEMQKAMQELSRRRK